MVTDGKSGRIVVALKTPEDILAAVPALIGFHPVDSVIFVGLHSSRNEAGLTVRIDIEDYLAHRARTVRQVADVYRRNNISNIIAVFYGPESDLGIGELFAEHDVTVLDVFLTSNEPHQVLPALEEQNVLHGRSVLPNREAMADSVNYRPGVQADHLLALLAVMGNTRERDRLITVALHQRDKILPLLITACQAIGDDMGVVACNLLATTAITAYRSGDGALALEALERSQRIDGDHVLTWMVMSLVTSGVTPGRMDALADEARLEVEAKYHGADLMGIWLVAAGVSP